MCLAQLVSSSVALPAKLVLFICLSWLGLFVFLAKVVVCIGVKLS